MLLILCVNGDNRGLSQKSPKTVVRPLLFEILPGRGRRTKQMVEEKTKKSQLLISLEA